MVDTSLDFLRQDALVKRVKGVAGSHPISWSARDIARIHDHVVHLPERTLREAAPLHKFVEPNLAATRSQLASTGMSVSRDMQSSDLKFVFRISSEDTDLMNDSIKIDAWDFANFARNPAVLNAHDSSSLPIATSTTPWVSGKTLLAIARFPQPGTSLASDEVAAAIRAQLVRGASVGFVPIKWSFSKDPARPLGVDFQIVKLLEWSICAIPCNPACLVIGAASDGKAAPQRRSAEDGSDWQCRGTDTMPIDSSDDAFDPAAAKAALLKNFSPNLTIVPDDAAKCFLAFDASAPLDAASYRFPFARLNDGTPVASKVGWRQAFAALEMADLPGLATSDARSLVERLELRLGDVKTAARREEARALARTAKRIAETPSPPSLTRAERIAQAKEFRRAADLAILKDTPAGMSASAEQQAARDRLTRRYLESGH